MSAKSEAGWPASIRVTGLDIVLPAAALLHAALLIAAPNALVISLALWWNANTVSHHFIHRPFFRSRSANALFALYLSLLLGFPHALWRDRHLAHHAGIHRRARLSVDLAAQTVFIVVLWISIAARAPMFFASVCVPGYIGGLALCWLHGYYEHAGGVTSYYGRLYNFVFFNDGYHAEHHARPSTHWASLPNAGARCVRTSSWPAPLRWIEALNLQTLERLVLASPRLQRFVLRTHASALGPLVAALPAGGHIAIVGGGLFPRTALILRALTPGARLTIIDADCENLDRARRFFPGMDVKLVHGRYPDVAREPYDAIVIPLSFEGNRDALYARPPAPAVLIHDWLWRKRGSSRIVSPLLLKRINLVLR